MYRKIIATEEKTDSKSLKSDENASKKIIFKYHYNTIQLYNLNNSKFTEKKNHRCLSRSFLTLAEI